MQNVDQSFQTRARQHLTVPVVSYWMKERSREFWQSRKVQASHGAAGTGYLAGHLKASQYFSSSHSVLAYTNLAPWFIAPRLARHPQPGWQPG